MIHEAILFTCDNLLSIVETSPFLQSSSP